MNYKEYEPNEKICKRMAQLWRRMLEAPKYDNGDPSDNGAMGMMLAHQVPKNNTADTLDKFELALFDLLMSKSQKHSPEDEGGYPLYLDVDYGPCSTLAEAAKVAELEMQFPWKTSSRVSESYITVSAGYAASAIYHYPLADGSWLLTSLYGGEADMDILKEMVELHPDKFTIEQ